jgi:hypothetical protein
VAGSWPEGTCQYFYYQGKSGVAPASAGGAKELLVTLVGTKVISYWFLERTFISLIWASF